MQRQPLELALPEKCSYRPATTARFRFNLMQHLADFNPVAQITAIVLAEFFHVLRRSRKRIWEPVQVLIEPPVDYGLEVPLAFGQIPLMKHLVAILILTCVSMARLPAGDNSADKPTLAVIAWLAGTWNSDVNGRQITEQWMSPAGGTMLGMSRTVAGATTVEYEFLVLREEKNGDVNYVAK